MQETRGANSRNNLTATIGSNGANRSIGSNGANATNGSVRHVVTVGPNVAVTHKGDAHDERGPAMTTHQQHEDQA